LEQQVLLDICSVNAFRPFQEEPETT